jgi:integrase
MTSRVWIARVKGRSLQLRWIDESGKERRRSTKTTAMRVAERQRAVLEAKLLLKRPVDVPEAVHDEDCGPDMEVDLFRHEYDRVYLSTLRTTSREHALSRIRICLNLANVQTLGELATRPVLERVQAKLRDGRSPWTVKTTMDAFLAALRWAERRDWIVRVPKIDRLKTSRLKAMKGRPITGEEFDKILAKVAAVVGSGPAESWRRTIRGYWESGLRRDELLAMSWDDSKQIMPTWSRGRFGVLLIPARLQKNDTEDEIPILPGFEALLRETPEDERHGWVFSPEPPTEGRKLVRPFRGRPTGNWVSRVIGEIAKAAGVATYQAGDVAHFATVHDLRRSCAQRLLLADVDKSIIKAVLRHRSWETTERHYAPGSVQKMAADLRTFIPNQERVPDQISSLN